MRNVLLALAFMLTGCGPYIDEVNAAHKSRIETKLEQARAVGKALASQAALADDRLPLPKAVLGYSWPSEKPSNAAFIYAEDFADLDQLGWVYARARNAGLVQRCSSLLHTEREPWDPAQPTTAPSPGFGFEADKLFDACEKLEYLFVIRTRAFAKPSEGRRQSPSVPAPSASDAGSDAGASDAGVIEAGADAEASAVPEAGTATGAKSNDYEFDGGYLDAEILVFELGSARFLGGLGVQAESSATLKGQATPSSVEQDLRSQVEDALSREVHKRAPEVVQRM